MLNQPTFDKMHAMKMTGMADALQQQLDSGSFTKLSFEERLGMLLDAEYAEREQRKLTRRLQRAKLRQPGACIEDVDFKARRSLNRRAFMALARCDWIGEALNVVITGPTGTGKTYLACALANKACRAGFTAYYVRGSQLPQQMAIARGDGTYLRLLRRITRTNLLVIDDWLLTPLTSPERHEILEVIEDRHERIDISGRDEGRPDIGVCGMNLAVADAEFSHPSHRLWAAVYACALLEVLPDGHALLGDGCRIRQRLAAPQGPTLAEDPRIADASPGDGHPIHAGFLHHSPAVFGREQIATTQQHAVGGPGAQFGQERPVAWPYVSLFDGPAVDGDGRYAGLVRPFEYGEEVSLVLGAIVHAAAHFEGHRPAITDGVHDAGHNVQRGLGLRK